MDELVRQALARWPNVPHCHGWLALDARGRWRIGPGRETITHAPTLAFINRNYLPDAAGNWTFQNGPQRVYVDLECTPYVWRLVPHHADGMVLQDHTGHTATHASGAWMTDTGRFVIAAAGRVGVLHDHDTHLLLERLCDRDGELLSEAAASARLAGLGHEGHTDPLDAGLWVRLPDTPAALPLLLLAEADLGRHFGFIPHPHPDGTS